MRRSLADIQRDIASRSKVCPKCEERKDFSLFNNSTKSKDGRDFTCAECRNKIKAQWRKNNKELQSSQALRDNLRAKYGKDVSWYEATLQEQGGCAICGAEWKGGKRFHIDHCHETGVIRGILCPSCNVGLGHFKDNADILKSAAKYLEVQWEE